MQNPITHNQPPPPACPPEGFQVVLTADRTLMARYSILFDGMLAASQTTTTPRPLMRLLAPRVRSKGLRAQQAPLGLRRIEAALIAQGWPADGVAVVCPEDLSRAVGPATRIIGLSSGDPLGGGMNSSTMVGIAGGAVHTARCFQRLARQVAKLRGRAPAARVVMGGPGAWQLALDDTARRTLGIDHLVSGYCEANVADLFRRLADGQPMPPLLQGRAALPDAIPPIRGPSVMGSVETSRGCGLGCAFCTIAHTPMTHLPADTILADVHANLSGGVTSISLVSEDILRYGATAGRVRPDALLDLMRSIRALPRLRLIQTDHANISSVAQWTDPQLAELHRLFVGQARRHRYVWLNLGVETASGQLLDANGGRAKMKPYPPEQWANVCLEQVRRLARAGFFPLISLLVGLEGETERHIEETSRWVAKLRHDRVAIFPLFHAPIGHERKPFGPADMSPAHWRLFRAAYRLNFRWIPRLYWDNQAGAGVPLPRRLLLQAFGKVQACWWKTLLAWRSRRLLRPRQ